MGFFDALRRVLGGDLAAGDQNVNRDNRIAEMWGLDRSPSPEFPERRGTAADPAAMAAPPATSNYDRDQWHRKLKRILEKLPASQGEWTDLMADAGALALDPAWVHHCQREEFALMLRRAVVDRHVTPEEHSKLELARSLIGIPEAEAEDMLHAIEAEARAFFNEPAEGA